ncbi:hypothetical protein OROHE_000889 [Orobanche hederae]
MDEESTLRGVPYLPLSLAVRHRSIQSVQTSDGA